MIEIGPFVIRLYGVMVGLGILAGFWVAARMAEKFSLRSRFCPSGRRVYALGSEQVWDALWWVVIPGVVLARLYHVFDLWSYYRENLVLIPAVWTGGVGIFGAIFGGIFGLWMYCWKICRLERGHTFRLLSKVWLEKVSGLLSLPGLKPGRSSLHEKTSTLFSSCVRERLVAFSDLAAFGVPVGQAIGRWGNFFNQELYGLPTDLPWGLAIPLEKRLSGFEQYRHFHPLFLYESLYSILVFGILLILWRVKSGKLALGSYFSMYLVMYGIGRYFLEGFRIETWTLAGINVAQALSLLMLVSGVYYLYSKNRE